MNNELNIYTLLAEQLFPVMVEYGFACHVWFLAGKHDQLISACRALLNIVKYVVCDIHSIQTRHNVIILC